MTIIHMEPEQVRSVAKQLEQTADQIYVDFEQVSGRVRGIPWQSPNRERYVRDMEQLRKQVQAVAQQGLDLSRSVQQEANEWEEVASSFGAVGAGAVAGAGTGMGIAQSPTDQPPKNMRLLAELVMEGSDPIRIYQIGPNEYLVLIQGTSNDPNASQNGGSAVATGLGLSSDYQEQVRLALLSLPIGAVVHMAGHSQGGIVAQNLAGDKSVQDRLNVKSVTTFGSPYSASEVDGVTYSRYATEGDVVPYLEGRDARDVTIVLLLAPFIGAVSVAGALSNRYSQTTIPGNFSDGTFGPHFEYNKSPALEKIAGGDMPFSITAWNGQPTVYDPGTAHSGAAVFYKNLASGVDTVAKTTQSAASAVGNAAQSAVSAVAEAAHSVAGAADNTVKEVGNFFGNLF